MPSFDDMRADSLRGGFKPWTPDDAYARATGATRDTSPPLDTATYESGIKNTAAVDGLEYITNRQFAEGLQKARSNGWDGVDYTHPDVMPLKQRFYASRDHDVLMDNHKKARIAEIQNAQRDLESMQDESAQAWID